MDFSRLERGRGAKVVAIRKQRKVSVTADNNVLRSFRKGCGESAKQGGAKMQVGCNRKGGYEPQRVRSDRKGFSGSGVKTQKDEPKPVLMLSIFFTFP